MLTDEDIQKLKAVFATKDDILQLGNEFRSEIKQIRKELYELREEMRKELYEMRDEMIEIKVELLAEMQNIRDDHMITVSYRDDIEDLNIRVTNIEVKETN